MTAVSLRNLKKTYNNGFQAIKGIDLDVQAGDFFALLGANGAGKSTTIGIISSLVKKTSGTVRLFGYDIDTQQRQAKQCLGLVPQEINFNQFETVQNILISQAGYYGIPKKQALINTEYYLKKMHLWEQRNTISRRLSGGMKRRVMIARALVNKPKLLILDEPTAGVDVEIRHSMWEMMREVNAQGTTIILTTHYLEEAENLCRNIAIIHQGLIVENSSMHELLSRVGMQYFVLDLSKPINTAPIIKDYTLKLNADDDANKTLIVGIPKHKTLNNFFHEISKHNVEVVSLKNKSNRLEQLFMDIVQ